MDSRTFQNLKIRGHCCLAFIDCQSQLDKSISCWVQGHQAENMNSLSVSFVEELLQFVRQSNLLQRRLFRRPIYQFFPKQCRFPLPLSTCIPFASPSLSHLPHLPTEVSNKASRACQGLSLRKGREVWYYSCRNLPLPLS